MRRVVGRGPEYAVQQQPQRRSQVLQFERKKKDAIGGRHGFTFREHLQLPAEEDFYGVIEGFVDPRWGERSVERVRVRPPKKIVGELGRGIAVVRCPPG